MPEIWHKIQNDYIYANRPVNENDWDKPLFKRTGGWCLSPPPLSKEHVGGSPHGFWYADFWEVPWVAVGRATSDLPDSVTPSGSQRQEPALQGIGCNWCEEGRQPAGDVELGRECGRDSGETWGLGEGWELWSVSFSLCCWPKFQWWPQGWLEPWVFKPQTQTP